MIQKPEEMICMNLSSGISLSKVSEKAVLHLPEKSCSKSIVFSLIPPLSGEPPLFVFFQSIVGSIMESKGINYNHVIIVSKAEF